MIGGKKKKSNIFEPQRVPAGLSLFKLSNVYYFLSEENFYALLQKDILLSSDKPNRLSANSIWLLNQEEIKQLGMASSYYKSHIMATGQKFWCLFICIVYIEFVIHYLTVHYLSPCSVYFSQNFTPVQNEMQLIDGPCNFLKHPHPHAWVLARQAALGVLSTWSAPGLPSERWFVCRKCRQLLATSK